MYIDIGLMAFVAASFAGMFYYQIRLMFKVIRPFKSEDDVQFGPFRITGPAKGRRISDFVGKPDPTGLRGKLARSWLCVTCAFLMLLLWIGVVREMVAA